MLVVYHAPLPPPHPHTHFPYTTLFRSSPPSAKNVASSLLAPTTATHEASTRWCSARISASAAESPDTRFRSSLSEEDRKSTRLNSSHSQISYAVFCLK